MSIFLFAVFRLIFMFTFKKTITSYVDYNLFCNVIVLNEKLGDGIL